MVSTRSGFCHGKGCQASEISWEESSGGDFPGFTQHTITTSLLNFSEMVALDIDRRERHAVTVREGLPPSHENIGTLTPSFNSTLYSSNTNGQGIFPADVDNDNDVDLLSSDGFNVLWYQNIGGDSFPTRFVGSTSSYRNDLEVAAAHLNSDGFMDLIAGGSALSWFRSNGKRQPTFTKTILDSVETTSLAPADIDGYSTRTS